MFVVTGDLYVAQRASVGDDKPEALRLSASNVSSNVSACPMCLCVCLYYVTAGTLSQHCPVGMKANLLSLTTADCKRKQEVV